jgi:hypothetical protein
VAEEIVTRRRVIRDADDDLGEDRVIEPGSSSGVGTALAIALAILLILAIIALARGAFNSSPNSGNTGRTSQPSNSIQTQPGTTTTQ